VIVSCLAGITDVKSHTEYRQLVILCYTPKTGSFSAVILPNVDDLDDIRQGSVVARRTLVGSIFDPDQCMGGSQVN